MDEEQQPGQGHNNPPPITASLDNSPDQWAERLAEVFESAIDRATDLMASYRRFETGFPLRPGPNGPIGIEAWNDAVQGRAGDLRDKIKAILTTAEATHALEKQPILVAQRAVDGFLRNFREPLDSALRTIRARQTLYGKWQEEESRRVAAEEARLLQEEAEAASAKAMRTLDTEALQKAADAAAEALAAADHANAAPQEHTRVAGETSTTALRGTWKFFPEESDLMRLARAICAGQAPLTYIEFNERRINLAVRAEKIRHAPGLVIREEKVAR